MDRKRCLTHNKKTRHVFNTIELCGFSKSDEGVKVVSQSDSREIHLPWNTI